MAVYKWVVLERTNDPLNDRMTLAVVRYRRYANQPAADADPALTQSVGFDYSWDSARDKRAGHAIFGSDLDAAYLDKIAPDIFASLDKKHAGALTIEATIGVAKTATPAQAPALNPKQAAYDAALRVLAEKNALLNLKVIKETDAEYVNALSALKAAKLALETP